MVTRIVSPTDMEAITRVLNQDRVVALPTETVYGLAARAASPDAVAEIFRVKGRPADNPLIVHAAHADEAFALVRSVPTYARTLAERYWPGPLTLVLESDRDWPWVQAGHETLAVRVPEPAYLRELLARVGPLAAPSANRSGRPSPTTAAHCVEDLDGRIPLIVDGGPCRGGLESTVVDCTGPVPRVLRPGPVTATQVRAAARDEKGSEPAEPVGGSSGGAGDGGATTEPAASPGTRHPHYQPRARVILVEDVAREPCRECMVIHPADSQPSSGAHLRRWHSPEELARYLYAWFREADELGLERIYVQAIPEEGLGEALMNRLRKAAAG